METISIHKAKASLSGLISIVEKQGERVVLCRYGKPVAEIIPFRQRKRSQPDPKLSQLNYSGDLTEPTLSEWQNA
jgi:prevent-host-death family protein